MRSNLISEIVRGGLLPGDCPALRGKTRFTVHERPRKSAASFRLHRRYDARGAAEARWTSRSKRFHRVPTTLKGRIRPGVPVIEQAKGDPDGRRHGINADKGIRPSGVSTPSTNRKQSSQRSAAAIVDSPPVAHCRRCRSHPAQAESRRSALRRRTRRRPASPPGALPSVGLAHARLAVATWFFTAPCASA